MNAPRGLSLTALVMGLWCTPGASQESHALTIAQSNIAPATSSKEAAREDVLRRGANLDIREVPLDEALKLLHETAGVPLLFSPTLLPDIRVSCDCAGASVETALNRMVRDHGLSYRVRGGQIMVFRPERLQSLLVSPPPIRALTLPRMPFLEVPRPQAVGRVTGIVTDAATGQPLAATEVFIETLGVGVLTQQNGRYLLQEIRAGTYTVSAQRIGFASASAEIVIGEGEAVVQDFALRAEALQLDEVIVTGTPGGTQRRAIGNTVARVDVSEVTERTAITNMQDLLSGRTPGVQFSRQSGNVGTGSPIKIRGVGSFDEARAQPIVFVDGIRVNYETNAGPSIGSGAQVNVLDDFNPEDIESIEIIKGPAAASLYGTEASAGVIQIITKRGGEGAAEFTVSLRQGTSFMMNPAEVVGEVWSCPTDPQPGPTLCQNESELVSANMYEETTRYIREGYFPWPTEHLFQNGHTQNFNVDVRGGTPSIRYFLSANYDDEEGIVWYNTDEAVRLRANVGVVFSDNFSLDVSTGYSRGNTRFEAAVPGDGGVLNDVRWGNPYYLDYVTPFGQPGSNPRLGGYEEHLPSDVAEVEATREYSRFTAGATLNFRAGAFDLGSMGSLSLTQRLILGLDRGDDVNRLVFPLEDGIVPEHLRTQTSTWGAVYSETTSGDMTYHRPINTVLSLDYALTADLEVGPSLSFATSVGAQYIEQRDESFANSGTGFASPLSRTINQLAQNQITTSYSYIENKSLGFYVQEMLGWNERLFLTGALRFDNNSTFGSDAPARSYPKLSASWLLSEEGFWSFNAVNSLRLRAAWGKSGRQPSATVGRNIYVPFRGPGGGTGIRPASPGNPSIEAEVSTELELGVDIALFADRLSAEFTHYRRKDEQALLNVPVSSDFGFPGSIDNWGWEALFRARVYESDLVSVEIDASIDYTDNEIKTLGTFPGTNNIRVGLPYPNHITNNLVVDAEWDPAGFYANDFGRRFNAWCDEGAFLGPDPNSIDAGQFARVPGGAAVLCQDIFDQIIFAGRGFATHTMSFAPQVSLFGTRLQIYALAEGQYGRIGVDNMTQSTHIKNTTRISRVQDDITWVADDRLNNTAGRLSWGRALFDADFWKLRELGVRYTLPQSWVQRSGAERASLAVSGRNLWTIWQAQSHISGSRVNDPEYGSASLSGAGGGWYNLPPVASVSATLRVTF